jgi:hypothetical protein
LLLAIQPAGQSGKKNPHGGDVDHSGSLHHRPTFEAGHRSAELWDTTGQEDVHIASCGFRSQWRAGASQNAER